MNDSEVHLGVHDAKRQRDETVEKLIEFDVSQTDALTTIQTDLMHMKTWITNIETMMTEGVTDVNFPAEQWQSFASQNPLMIALAYRTQSLDQVINMLRERLKLNLLTETKEDTFYSFMPSLFVNFDKRELYSLYSEPASYEDFVPENWTGRYEDFLSYIDRAEKYWYDENEIVLLIFEGGSCN